MATLGLIFLLLFLLILSFLLFAPIQLEINSLANFFQVKWGKLVSANLRWVQDDILLIIQIAFYKTELYPLAYLFKPKEVKPKEKGPVKKKKKTADFRKNLVLGKKILGSFKVKQFRLHLDTDDYVLNAYLYPVFHFLNKNNRQLAINFTGDFDCYLLIENRGIWILRALLK